MVCFGEFKLPSRPPISLNCLPVLMIKISKNVQSALADQQLQRNLRHTFRKSVRLCDVAVSEIPNWEELRQYARNVKAHTLSRLAHYLEMLEQKISAQGGEVIWAETGQDAVQFIVDIAQTGTDSIDRNGLGRVRDSIGWRNALAHHCSGPSQVNNRAFPSFSTMTIVPVSATAKE